MLIGVRGGFGGLFALFNSLFFHGNVIFWYRNGKIKSSKVYKYGDLNDKYKEYRVTGTKISSGFMSDNEMNGKWTFWYHNGQKECELICKNGELVDGKIWDNGGNEKENIRFKHLIGKEDD